MENSGFGWNQGCSFQLRRLARPGLDRAQSSTLYTTERLMQDSQYLKKLQVEVMGLLATSTMYI